MAKKTHSQWFVELALLNNNTLWARTNLGFANEALSEAVRASPDEGRRQGGQSFTLDVPCEDGKKRQLCSCTRKIAQDMWKKWNALVKVTIWNRANQYSLARDITFTFRKPMRQIIRRQQAMKKDSNRCLVSVCSL